MSELMRWDPTSRVRSLRSMVDSLFDDFARWPLEFMPQQRSQVAVDLIERDTEYVLKANVPGFCREDLDIEIGEDSLVISGKRDEEREEVRGGYRVRERHSGTFSRVIPLPPGVDTQKAKAHCKNGVLEVVLPRIEPEQPKRQKIQIEDN